MELRLAEIGQLANELATSLGCDPAGAGSEGGEDAVAATLRSALAAARRQRERSGHLERFFEESRDGFFFMMLEKPTRWDETVDKEAVLEEVFVSQRITRANQAMLAQYRASAEDFVGLTPKDFFEHDMEQGKRAWRELFEAGVLQTHTHEARFDGTMFWVDGMYVALHDDEGRIVGHFGSQREVTEEVEVLDRLRRSEARLDEAQRIAHIGHWDWNVVNNDLLWSKEIYRILGLVQQEDMANYADFVEATHEEDRDEAAAAVGAALEGAPYSLEHRVVRPDGEIRWVHERGEVHFDSDAKPVRMLGTAQDITERKATERALRAALALSDGVVAASPIGLAIYDETGRCLKGNEAVATVVGATREQVLQQNWREIESWKAAGLYDAADRAMSSRTVQRLDIAGESTFGQAFTLACQLVPLDIGEDHRLLLMAEDITERKRAEDELKSSLREKEILLQEIHHRVKNNLQVIKSLLHLQMAKLDEPSLQAVFQESMDRVQVMAVLHEKLYQSANLASVSLPEYVESLTGSLVDSYDASSRPITIEMDVEEQHLDVDRAIPLGLLLNEIVSNALKHAFPDGREGTIQLTGREEPSGHFRVSVWDDGVGIPDEVDSERATTLGLKLITNLARQLGAELTMDRTSGTRFELLLAPPA